MLARQIVIDAINGSDVGFTAYRTVPSKRPDEFAVVELTGGGDANPVQCEPSVDVDCWAQTSYRAEEMAEAVKGVLFGLPGSCENVFGATVTTTYDNPDLESGTPRCTVGAVIYANN